MNKKLRNNAIAIASMVVLSLGIIVAIKYTNGDFGAKQTGEPIEVVQDSNGVATVLEASRFVNGEGVVDAYEVTVSTVGFNAAEPIQMKVKFDGETAITGIEVVSQNETPGLGANITTEDFAAQFNGVAAPVYTADMEAVGTAIDQVSGATISSKAVAEGINAAYEMLLTIQ